MSDTGRRCSESGQGDAAAPRISFGFRGENLSYQREGRTLEAAFTCVNGPRLYPDTIRTWSDGAALTAGERQSVFLELLEFLVGGGDRPIVVINRDDPAREAWERIALERREWISGVEHTSNAG